VRTFAFRCCEFNRIKPFLAKQCKKQSKKIKVIMPFAPKMYLNLFEILKMDRTASAWKNNALPNLANHRRKN
jgi:hypothetical protein